MRKIRFANISWLLLIPVFATIKILWELNTPNADNLLIKPFPISWLDTKFPEHVFLGVFVILFATYFVFAYINAFIKLQTTYTIAIFFSILSSLAFTPELTSSLFAILLFMNGILRLVTLEEKQKSVFAIFDTGLFIGLALLFEVHLIFLAVTLSVFLFIFRFSFREFLQYWAGMLIPPLFVFPFLFFSGLLTDWQRYFEEIPQAVLQIPNLSVSDYILIGGLTILSSIQALKLYVSLKKPTEHLLLLFLFIYFIISLSVSIFAYHNIEGGYILFIIPPMTILYSLSKHEKHSIPILITLLIIGYLIWQLVKQYSIG